MGHAIEAVYTDAVEKLEVEVDERNVDTQYGETHALSTGSENGEPVIVFQGTPPIR